MSGPAGKKRQAAARRKALPWMLLYLCAPVALTLGVFEPLAAPAMEGFTRMERVGMLALVQAPGFAFSLVWVWTAVTRLVEPDWRITWMSQKTVGMDGRMVAVDDRLRTGAVSRGRALAMIGVGLFFWLCLPGMIVLGQLRQGG